MIVVNICDDIISGSINEEVFARTFDQKIYDEMKSVAEKANTAGTVKELKEFIEEFKALAAEDISGYLGTFHDDIFIDNKTGKHYLKHNDVVSAIPMPDAMVDRIKDSMDKKIDISPLLKAWIRFLRNPKVRVDRFIHDGFGTRFFEFLDIKFTNQEMVLELMSTKGYSEEVATKMATTYSMKITNEGLLSGFKVSNEITTRYRLDKDGKKEAYDVYKTGKKSIDPISGLITNEEVSLDNEHRVFEPVVMGTRGDAFFCGDDKGHIIRVGKTHRLEDWSKVDCDDERTGRPGLHVGGLDYIRGFQTEGSCTHNVFIDPAHVGAIPDSETGAIRCLQYFVADEFKGVNGSVFHSSTYASQTDAEWDTEKAEIIKKHGEYKAEDIKDNDKVIKSIGGL